MARSSEPNDKTPVLIIPGFMSSGLTIRKSPHKSWEGRRLWLNITAAGFNSLHRGGALAKNENYRSNRLLDGADASSSIDQSSEEMHQEYVKQMECKSRWVWHMRLESDMLHEREGLEIRPLVGTAGVDYLAPGALTEAASYVFGPVLKILKAEGYTEGLNLDAAPYDWRIPPSVLESRDNYFTNTMKTIERLYRKSNNTPVLLLCHSMGCRTGHYLLNFVLYQLGKADGQAWIDRHIHSYVPVGAPHLGAQKTLRCVIDGDKMGLEAFLSDEEGLVLGRSFGSTNWLFPLESDSVRTPPQSATDTTTPQPPPLPTAILRHESTIKIELPAQCIQLTSFTHHRKREPPTKLRLAIQIGNDVIVRTDFVDVNSGGRERSSLHVNFADETWLVACPPTIEQTLHLYPYIQLHLEEPGTGSAPKNKKGISHIDVFWPFRCAWCLFKWIFCFPCAVVWKLGCCVVCSAKRGADVGAALLGEIRVIGQSGRVDWKKGVIENNQKKEEDGGEGGGSSHHIYTQLEPTDNGRHGFFLEKPTPEKIIIKVKWEPSALNSATSTNIVCHKSHAGEGAGKLKLFDNQSKHVSYVSSNSNQLLEMEGLRNAIHLVKETYGKDPMGPHSLSASQPPPVKKVIAIYGINLPTEISCAYKRNPSARIRRSLDQLFVLDKEATLNEESNVTHVIQNGVISETKNTPQTIIGDNSENIVQSKSGDGTVPYWSLQHCRAWQGDCDVKVHELDKAEHRAILNDKRFHDLLLDLVREPSRVVVVY